MQYLQGPPGQEGPCTGPSEILTKLWLFAISSTHQVCMLSKWPTVKLTSGTFCFVAVSVLRVQSNFTVPQQVNTMKPCLNQNTAEGSQMGLPLWQWLKHTTPCCGLSPDLKHRTFLEGGVKWYPRHPKDLQFLYRGMGKMYAHLVTK